MERLAPTTTKQSFLYQKNEVKNMLVESVKQRKEQIQQTEYEVMKQHAINEPDCKTCDEIIKSVNEGTADALTSSRAVVEHFISKHSEPFDIKPKNIYTKIDHVLTSIKSKARKEAFCDEYWHDISSAIIVVIAIIFLTFVIQLFTGTIKICIKSNVNECDKGSCQ